MKDKFGIFSHKIDYKINTDVYIKNYLNDNIQYHYSIIDINSIKSNSDNILNIIKDNLRCKKNNIITLAKKLKISSENITEYIYNIIKKIDFLEQIFKFKCMDLHTMIFNIIISNPYIKDILRYEISNKKNIDKFLLYCKNKLNEQECDIIYNQINDIFIDLKPDKTEFNELSIIVDKKYLDYYYLNSILDFIINYKNIYKSISVSNKFFNKISTYFVEYIEDNQLAYQNDFILFLDKYKYKIKYLNFINNILYLYLFDNNDINNLIKLINIIKYLDDNMIDNNIKYIYSHFKCFETEEIIINLAKIINNNIINNITNEHIYQIICNSKYVELFLNINQLNLLKRYIYTDCIKDNEYKYYKQMEKYFTKKQMYKYNKTLKKLFDSCIEDNSVEDEIKYIDIGVNIWPLNTIDGYSYECINSTIYYKYLHIGRYEFEFTSNKGTFNITSLPIHYYMINDIINNNLIYYYKFYKKEYISKIANQLIDNKIIYKNDYNEYLINKEYNGGDIDLIDYEEINKMTINKIKNNIAHEEKHIIISNISSILKTNNYSHNDIFKIIKDKVSSYIDFNINNFENAIKEMIEKDYIVLKDDMYYKYVI